jgi:hypothetical protein
VVQIRFLGTPHSRFGSLNIIGRASLAEITGLIKLVGEFVSLKISFAGLRNNLILGHFPFSASVQVPLFLRTSGLRLRNGLPHFFFVEIMPGNGGSYVRRNKAVLST